MLGRGRVSFWGRHPGTLGLLDGVVWARALGVIRLLHQTVTVFPLVIHK